MDELLQALKHAAGIARRTYEQAPFSETNPMISQNKLLAHRVLKDLEHHIYMIESLTGADPGGDIFLSGGDGIEGVMCAIEDQMRSAGFTPRRLS